MLDIEPWSDATKELDVKIWVECERSVARERLIERHLESGIEPDRQAAEERGELALAHRPYLQILMDDTCASSRWFGHVERRVHSRQLSRTNFTSRQRR